MILYTMAVLITVWIINDFSQKFSHIIICCVVISRVNYRVKFVLVKGNGMYMYILLSFKYYVTCIRVTKVLLILLAFGF